MFLIELAVIIVLIWAYILLIRPQLHKRFPATWERIDKIEAFLFERSRTLIVSRLSIVGGAVIAVHDALAAQGLDLTPLLQQFQDYVPPQYRFLLIPVALAAFGLLFEWIKRTHAEQATGAQ